MRRFLKIFALALAAHAVGCTKSPDAAPIATAQSTTAPTAAAPDSVATSQPQKLSRLTVTVTDLRNRNGQLIFGVFSSAAGFPSESTKSINWQTRDIDTDSVTFTADLPPGIYAASVLHDENRNDQMDKNVASIPKEGYGVTNNPKPKLRAARFDEATFTLPADGATMTISVQYF